MFHVKDRLPRALRSNVVYKFTCGVCNASYIGQTTRHFHVRACEHLGVSHKTGRAVKLPPTAVSAHASASGHAASINNFAVLAPGVSVHDLLVKEALFIRYQKPYLNIQGQVSCTQLHLF